MKGTNPVDGMRLGPMGEELGGHEYKDGEIGVTYFLGLCEFSLFEIDFI